MHLLQVNLFGGLTLTWEGHPARLRLPGGVARSLLAYLITYHDRTHTRDLLAGTFWPDLPDATARQRLSQTLWQINRTFEQHPFLGINGETIQINPLQPLWVDVDQFKNDRGHNPSAEPALTQSLETCIALYRGEFLAGFYDDWVLPERERLRNTYLDYLARLIEAAKSQGEFKKALAFADKLAMEDPWNEAAHREVMRLAHLLGRRADAQIQFEICCRMLREELGIEPAAETQALALEIAAQTGANEPPWMPRAARAEHVPLLERPDRLPLVGRQSELAELLNQVETAARGEGGLTLIYGEAGVGKTRLLGELARNADWRGISTAWGRCYELNGPPAYQPLIEALQSELPLLRETLPASIWRAELARLLPELAASETPPHLDPEKEQHRILEAIARGFQAIAQAKPYLVILEDAHWMDPGSLAAIRYLLPRLAEMELRVVISARSEDLADPQAGALQALENTRLPQRLQLERFDLDETGQLIQRALDLEQPPARFSARLYTETEGNPFFLTETLRTLMEDGWLYRNASGIWSTPLDDSTEDYAELPLPGSVIQSITRRLARLPTPARQVMELAAVIGRGVPFELWRKASELGEIELINLSDQLCAQGLLICAERDNPAQADFDYIFAHDQIRRVTYDQLAPPRQRFYHRRVAEALTELIPVAVEALAYHWSAAQVWDQAANHHQRAGAKAGAVYANAEAVDHYSQALQALQHVPGAPDLQRIYEIRLAQERVFELQGERTAQTQELDALANLAESLNDDRCRAEVALRRARLAELICDFPPAIAAASRAVELAHAAQDIVIEIESQIEWGWVLLLQGEHTGAYEQFERANALARTAGLIRLEADGLHGLGTVDLVTGNYSEAKTYFQQVLEICRRVDIRPREGSTYANLGYIATAQGDHAASKAYNEQALRIHRATGDQRGAALVTQNLSDEFLAEGDFATAKDYMEQALSIQQMIQARDNIGVTLRGLGILYHQLGAYDQARDYYEQAQAIFIETGIPFYQGQTLAHLSLLSHHLDDHQAAYAQSQRGLEIAREIDDRLGQGWLLDALGHALTGLGQLEQAREAYQTALALRQELDEHHLAAESRAGLARVAQLQGDLPAARQLVTEILQGNAIRGFGGTNEPFRIYLTCYRVLQACQDPQANAILSTAYESLMRQKAMIQDVELEYSFLEKVAAHREIVAAYQQQQGAKLHVQLPKKDAPTGRTLRPDERLEITWTPHVPEDEAIPGKTARRQHRLQRLLQEAASQGAVPTIEGLATSLDVSFATIRRDLATLRQAGIPVQTRGSRAGPSK